MKVAVGIYKDSLDNPVNEQIVYKKENGYEAIRKLNPSSGIWLVSMYNENNERIEQQAVYCEKSVLRCIERAFDKGTMKTLNFNELAYKMPKHGDRYEYQPGDKWYEEVLTWLKEAIETIWTTTDGNETTKRLSFGEMYDVVATWFSDTNGISYIFREAGVYEV